MPGNSPISAGPPAVVEQAPDDPRGMEAGTWYEATEAVRGPDGGVRVEAVPVKVIQQDEGRDGRLIVQQQGGESTR